MQHPFIALEIPHEPLDSGRVYKTCTSGGHMDYVMVVRDHYLVSFGTFVTFYLDALSEGKDKIVVSDRENILKMAETINEVTSLDPLPQLETIPFVSLPHAYNAYVNGKLMEEEIEHLRIRYDDFVVKGEAYAHSLAHFNVEAFVSDDDPFPGMKMEIKVGGKSVQPQFKPRGLKDGGEHLPDGVKNPDVGGLMPALGNEFAELPGAIALEEVVTNFKNTQMIDMSKLRKALGESQLQSHFVRTFGRDPFGAAY